ncbi:MAG TPA: hypothetical protein IGS53_13940 [Leptolyngbyaceae cyanobacterium M33_DOE_097]|nr:hypothetical protein [Leptolyngbyaceae cyanobacterium M33_DOE_097]
MLSRLHAQSPKSPGDSDKMSIDRVEANPFLSFEVLKRYYERLYSSAD